MAGAVSVELTPDEAVVLFEWLHRSENAGHVIAPSAGEQIALWALRCALESALVECPLELGPHLRMQYLDQPEGGDGSPLTHGRAPAGSITVASFPLDESDETPKGFYLRRVDGVLWLRGYWSWAGHVWGPTDLLLFAR